MFLMRAVRCPALTQERTMRTANDNPSTGRALVSIAPEHNEPHSHRPIHRVASFVTQLIANHSRLPQARDKRRANPAEVIAAYRATVERIQRLNEKIR
jgi:hypothetical protein